MNRQKVSEVGKLAQTVCELEEAVLAGGAAANAVRDYERRLQQTNVNISLISSYKFETLEIVMFSRC